MRCLLIITLIGVMGCNPSTNHIDKSTSEIELDTIFLENLNKDIPYQVYLPETYNDKDKLPILYLLHGHGADDKSWFHPEMGNAATILDSLTNAGAIPPIVAVTMHAGNSWYVDRNEFMEAAYIKEFIPHIESKYRVTNENSSRLIAGNSMGGFGALRFSLKYPELFKASILLSPASYEPVPPAISSSRKIDVFAINGVFNDSIWNSFSYMHLLNNDTAKYPKFYLSTGDDDPFEIFTVVNGVRAFLMENQIEVETTVIDGEHTWDVWRNRLAYVLTQIYGE